MNSFGINSYTYSSFFFVLTSYCPLQNEKRNNGEVKVRRTWADLLSKLYIATKNVHPRNVFLFSLVTYLYILKVGFAKGDYFPFNPSE